MVGVGRLADGAGRGLGRGALGDARLGGQPGEARLRDVVDGARVQHRGDDPRLARPQDAQPDEAQGAPHARAARARQQLAGHVAQPLALRPPSLVGDLHERLADPGVDLLLGHEFGQREGREAERQRLGRLERVVVALPRGHEDGAEQRRPARAQGGVVAGGGGLAGELGHPRALPGESRRPAPRRPARRSCQHADNPCVRSRQRVVLRRCVPGSTSCTAVIGRGPA